jgi:hypothetical protein
LRNIARRRLVFGVAGGTALLLVGCQAPSAVHPTKSSDLKPFTGLPRGAASPAFPSFVSATVRDGYEFAVARPDVLVVLPCYCGCGLEAGHKSNLDCFVAGVDKAGAVVMDEHASYCQTCLDIARDAKTLVAQGKTLPEIRKVIDERHSNKGPGTDTPKPSAGRGRVVA